MIDFMKILLLAALCQAGGAALARQPAAPAAPTTTLTPPVLAQPPKIAPGGAALPPASPPGQHTLDKADADAWLDGYLPYALGSGDIPGAVVVVVKEGRILTARGYGVADVDKRTPVDPERTLFRIGSVSKLLTWTAVMQLVEQKKLDLDADVNTYLDFVIPPRAGAPVTLRQIMTHTAGFEESAKNLIFYDPAGVGKLGDLLKAWIPERIFDAGTTPAYSNYATALAGYIVERTSGLGFDDYVESRIFKPLAMHGASFRQPLPATLAPFMATGYSKPGEPSMGYELIGPAPAGSMAASGTDMARFMLAHLQNGELDGQRILSAATAAAMHVSALDKIKPASLLPPLNRMELGFFETNINGRAVIAHLGDLEAFHTSLHLFTKEGVGLYVSFNSGGKGGAAGTLRTALFQDFSDRYLPGAGAADGKVGAADAIAHARAMRGVWQSSRRSESNFFSILGFLGQVKVDVNAKGELVVPALVGRNGRPREWVEIAPYLWRDRNGHDRLAAQLVNGEVVRWSMDFMSPFMVFDRAPAGKSSGWMMPALYASLAVLLMTLLAWPAGAFCRRKYRVPQALAGNALRAARATQVFSGLSLLVLAGWVGIFAVMHISLKYASAVLDPWLWLVQIAGLLVFVGAVPAAGWNLGLAWTGRRSIWARLWSILVVAATLVVLYIALRFGLLALSVNY